ncbi:hypothetical protein PtA15_11A429 [Puccinia triticina]|uniref:Uncharacterized protein n=1 Tax=Puccinia triticina TaxID=208348 RepID=A0ABY7CWR5_9BASI|nr:uncharacterized protein PtA15_11A429 [Puccinia triticina]WAQ89738.1 hypothetical protein PtA15_11A429 [Puccinia triticina]WAR59787.1 hypothetical protein PtB15_11B428 [Puccinia triticina]
MPIPILMAIGPTEAKNLEALASSFLVRDWPLSPQLPPDLHSLRPSSAHLAHPPLTCSILCSLAPPVFNVNAVVHMGTLGPVKLGIDLPSISHRYFLLDRLVCLTDNILKDCSGPAACLLNR